jgi:hypothetical protein
VSDAPSHCPSCGATYRGKITNCWLCYQPLDPDAPKVSKPSPPRPKSSGVDLRIAAVTLPLIFLLILAELSHILPRELVLTLIVVLVPVALSNLAPAQDEPPTGGPPRKKTTLQKVMYAVGILLSSLAVIASLMLACMGIAFVAAFIYCLNHSKGIE